ncbi:hypothetical protein M409DRAFT_28434 [Zasmidium cellare ATCC 36951]|uniref:Phytocyanin domain-containing protein n=1 Tax=Zasmidium cellare ATCC 36951 TaxID=1080233 RepID=A0A6A6C209_ZASCE|nr:uncharacterized protein M409DRAFT_28434 [Zasmidium cellare ATCC 36951]KAF2161104.1 hypothetical protein M409DRAFT_28434 [Zasmidium cellare ATCC 36951]
MHFSRAVIAALLSICAFAQRVERDHDEDTTFSEGETTYHIITVGKYDHEFYPAITTANVHDVVMFRFYPDNHSVIESLYRWPCVYRDAVDGQGGFHTEGFPLHDFKDEDHLPTWNFTVEHLDPIFFYCGAPSSCVSKGMVGAINPSSDQNITAQKKLAIDAGIVNMPDETLTPNAAASVSAAAESDIPVEQDDETKRMPSPGAVAGIVIGGIVALAIIILSIFYPRRRRQKKALQTGPSESATQAHTTAAHAPEMQIDGITYVPATDPRAFYNPQPPSYYHLSAEMRPKSPGESTFSGPHGAPTTLYSPSIGSIRNRYSDIGPDTMMQPQPQPVTQLPLLQELDAQPQKDGSRMERKYLS